MGFTYDKAYWEENGASYFKGLVKNSAGADPGPHTPEGKCWQAKAFSRGYNEARAAYDPARDRELRIAISLTVAEGLLDQAREKIRQIESDAYQTENVVVQIDMALRAISDARRAQKRAQTQPKPEAAS